MCVNYLHYIKILDIIQQFSKTGLSTNKLNFEKYLKKTNPMIDHSKCSYDYNKTFSNEWNFSIE